MAHIGKKTNEKYTYKDYITWPENERWEIIEGTPYNMSPAPFRIHQKISMRLAGEFYQYLKDKTCEVYDAPFDVRLLTDEKSDDEIETIVQPDIVVVCDPLKLDDKGCKGAPDLVIEILSPSSVSIDHVTKLHLYEKHGVKEYWIVHPTDKIIMVYLLSQNGKYERAIVYTGADMLKVNVLENFTIHLKDIFRGS